MLLSIFRDYVHPVCGDCDVSLHPSQLVSCHPDPHAADTAHSSLHVWSVAPPIFPVLSLFSFSKYVLITKFQFLSPETCVFAFLGLSIFSFPHNFELSFVSWCIVSARLFLCFYLNGIWDCCHDSQCYSCCSLDSSWFFSAERWTSSLFHSCWTSSETTRSHPKWCSSCGLVVRWNSDPFYQCVTTVLPVCYQCVTSALSFPKHSWPVSGAKWK